MSPAGVEPASNDLGNRRLSNRPRGRSARPAPPRCPGGGPSAPQEGCRTGIAPASTGSQPVPVTRRVTTPCIHSNVSRSRVGRRGLAPRSPVLQTSAILRLAHGPLSCGDLRSPSNTRLESCFARRVLGGRRFRYCSGEERHPRSDLNRRAPSERRRSWPLDDGGIGFLPECESHRVVRA